MYISVKILHNQMGVDETIARFFVDRKIPDDNIFWKKRLLYISTGNGYISIPVYYDLLFRLGVSKQILLEESHVVLMERIMHFAMQVEYYELSFAEQIKSISHLLEGRIRNQDFYDKLIPYLLQPVIKPDGELGMVVPSLNRADVFLFILCDLSLSKEQTSLAVKYWYPIHTSYLLMDDIYDYKSDKESNDENAVIQLEEGEEGFDKAFKMVNDNIELLRPINPQLSNYFETSMAELRKFIS
jgi:hypothetical protein